MTKQEVYNIWAPPDGPWSTWAKPVLFAHMPAMSPPPGDMAMPAVDIAWAPPADGSTVIVLDLPGNLGVAAAMRLAEQGYRPVPLYNAVPSPVHTVFSDMPLGTATAACVLWPIMAAILTATPALDALNLPYQAPPVFLLDADRRYGTGATIMPGMFDNRSVSLPTDFPSATHLLSQGVRRAIVVQHGAHLPQEDLAHTLLRWQEAGIEILAVALSAPSEPTPIEVAKPSLYRTLWQRLTATLGLRRNPLGGFGGFLPIPSSSGG
jgi:hypothetical protein